MKIYILFNYPPSPQKKHLSTNLDIFHDKVLFRLEIKNLLQLDNVRVGDGAEDRDLALDHVLLSLTLRLELKLN